MTDTSRKGTVGYSRTVNRQNFNSERFEFSMEFDLGERDPIEVAKECRENVRLASELRDEPTPGAPEPQTVPQPAQAGQTPPVAAPAATEGYQREPYTRVFNGMGTKVKDGHNFMVRLNERFKWDTRFTWWEKAHVGEPVPQLTEGTMYDWIVEAKEKAGQDGKRVVYYDLIYVGSVAPGAAPLPPPAAQEPNALVDPLHGEEPYAGIPDDEVPF